MAEQTDIRLKQLERLAEGIRWANHYRVRHEQQLTTYKARAEQLPALLEEWETLKNQGYPVEGFDLNDEGESPLCLIRSLMIGEIVPKCSD